MPIASAAAGTAPIYDKTPVLNAIIQFDSQLEVTAAIHHLVAITSVQQPIPDPFTIVSTVALVTASDMVPFVPCQPLAIALGSTLGVWAFPICVMGQSLAGILAFQSARLASDLDSTKQVLESLTPKALEKFEDFRRIGSSEKESTVLLGLIGLRLAPFFPFSAGNYLLGGATGVGLRPFVTATLFGCLLSNLLSVAIGIGASELLQQP